MNMKEKYEHPQVTVIDVEIETVIAASVSDPLFDQNFQVEEGDMQSRNNTMIDYALILGN